MIFDRIHYNNGSWYNPVSGVYETPITGYYLITEQVGTTTEHNNNTVKCNPKLHIYTIHSQKKML